MRQYESIPTARRMLCSAAPCEGAPLTDPVSNEAAGIVEYQISHCRNNREGHGQTCVSGETQGSLRHNFYPHEQRNRGNDRFGITRSRMTELQGLPDSDERPVDSV